MREIRSEYFVFSGCAPETFLHLVKMSFWWFFEFLGQERALQGRHGVSKPEVCEVAEMKDEEEKAVVYRNSRAVKESRSKFTTFILVLSLHFSPSRSLRLPCVVSPTSSPIASDNICKLLRGESIRIFFCLISVPSDFIFRPGSCRLQVNGVCGRMVIFSLCSSSIRV